jgi:hypothetical protein
MSWFSRWLEDDRKTFDQDLELLIARWTDMSRKGSEALSIHEIGNRLLDKAERILDEDAAHRKRKKHDRTD